MRLFVQEFAYHTAEIAVVINGWMPTNGWAIAVGQSGAITRFVPEEAGEFAVFDTARALVEALRAGDEALCLPFAAYREGSA